VCFGDAHGPTAQDTLASGLMQASAAHHQESAASPSVEGELRAPIITLVWDRFHARNQAYGRALNGIACHVRSLPNRKPLLPLRYVLDGIQTWRLLNRHRPAAVIVGSPPAFAMLVAWWWCRRNPCRLVVDCHTGAFHGRKWRWSLALHRMVARRATLMLAHIEEDEAAIRSWPAPALLLPSDLPDVSEAQPQSPPAGARVVVAGSLDGYEPVPAVLDAARLIPDVEVWLTGDTSRIAASVVSAAPPNVRFTGWLEYPKFLGELLAADVVAVFSTDRRIMNRSAFEAIGLGRPLVLSDFQGLRSRFGPAAIFTPNEPRAMADAMKRALVQKKELAAMSAFLKPRLQAQRERALAELKAMLDIPA
jgi:glycosyltransferase involved in cell wall biosynthesis